MRTLILSAIVLFFISSIGGCAGNRKAIRELKESNERLRQEVESLKRRSESLVTAEETLKDLKIRLDVLEGKMTDEGESEGGEEGEIQDTTEEIEQLTARIEALEEKAAGVSKPAEQRQAASEKRQIESPVPSSPKRMPIFRPERYDVQQSYREALKDYRERRYDQAIGEFTEILSMAPESDLSDNAEYWIGECHYALNNYQQAIASFEQVLTHPRSEKLDDAQLKIGYSYLKAGKREEAVVAFKKVLSDYPNSEYRGRAEAMITSIGGGK